MYTPFMGKINNSLNQEKTKKMENTQNICLVKKGVKKQISSKSNHCIWFTVFRWRIDNSKP